MSTLNGPWVRQVLTLARMMDGSENDAAFLDPDYNTAPQM